MSDKIRILIVDDQYLIREGIASLLELEDGMEVVGLATNGQEAIQQATQLKPAIVLMDVRMPEMNGVEATAQIRQRIPACQVIMLTTFNDDEFIVQSLLAGACGYLMKDLPPQALSQAIKLAHAGMFQLAPEVAGKLVSQLRQQQTRPPQPTANPSLTTRERDILRLLAHGDTNKEIAQQLHVSEGTVKNHISNILTKLNLRDRTQAAVYAVEHDLTESQT